MDQTVFIWNYIKRQDNTLVPEEILPKRIFNNLNHLQRLYVFSFLRYRARLLEIWQEKYPKKGEQLYNQNEVREINTHTIKTEGTISIQIHNG